MEVFAWDSRYETELPEVDFQHKHLVGLINEAGRLREQGGDTAEVVALVDALTEYARSHFAMEERMMDTFGCDQRHVQPHLRAHRSFLDQVALMRQMDGVETGRMVAPILTLLSSWLAFHILGTDQSLGRQVAAIRRGVSAAEAFAREPGAGDPATGVLLDVLLRQYDQLAAHTGELAQANRDLEQRVAERTQGLQETNATLEREQARQAELIKQLEDTQTQLVQSEKLAALGQLAAGVAHEINNPVGFVSSNLSSLKGYLATIFGVIDAYAEVEHLLQGDAPALARLAALRDSADLEFLRQDVDDLVAESLDGLQRVKRIVRDLKGFARMNESEWLEANLNEGLESTLNVVWNELKYKVELVKEYGELPPVRCIPSQINQVMMNLLVNAGQAIETSGRITLRTGAAGERVWIEIEDTGSGMLPEVQKRMFEPFYTTKPIGKGTGLGMSVSHGIVSRHGGEFEVSSEPGRGTTIRVWLPVAGAADDAQQRNAA